MYYQRVLLVYCCNSALFWMLFLNPCHCNGTIIQAPNNVTYFPGLTSLPIVMICNVTGVAAWVVNDTTYFLSDLSNGLLLGHNRSGTNMLINIPINNTEYVCLSQTNDGSMQSEPAYILIAGVPTVVPGVTFDSNTISINENIVTLILNWEEPFNNFDPIVNYTVSCSGDVTCPPNFTTVDNATSYTITNLTPMTNYTFSVVATNSIGSGEAGVIMITTPPGIAKVTGITLTCEPVSLMDHQCTVMWNPVTQGDITGYQVYYNGTMITINSSTTALTFTAPSLPVGVFSATVIVTVTALNRLGTGIPSDPATTKITVSSSVTKTTVTYISYNATGELYSIIVDCTIHPDSTADHCVVTAMANDRNITGTASIINRTAMVLVSELHCGVSYNIIAEGMYNKIILGPGLSYGALTTGLCPLRVTTSHSGDNKSDSELSTGVVIAVTTVATLIITLVVTTLITYIITSLYYKYRYELKEKVKGSDDDMNVIATQKDLYGGNIMMDTNPAYGTAATIKMDNNPAYATAT